MGLCWALETSPSLMNKFLDVNVDDILAVYLDCIFIFSNSKGDHLIHIVHVLPRLYKPKIFISPKKYIFMHPEVEFLGLILGFGGI